MLSKKIVTKLYILPYMVQTEEESTQDWVPNPKYGEARQQLAAEVELR